MGRAKFMLAMLILVLVMLTGCLITILLTDGNGERGHMSCANIKSRDMDIGMLIPSYTTLANTTPSDLQNPKDHIFVKYRVTPLQNASSPCGRLSFRPCCWPLTALASFPGSGNTWTRHLMQQATGFYTGDIYMSPLNRRDGWAGEGHKDKSTLNVKTHLKPSAKGQPNFERAVLLIRDVEDAVLAEFNRKMAGPVGRVPGFVYTTDKWTSSFEKLSTEWVQFNLAWLRFVGDVYILRYEQLKTNLMDELPRVCHFMDVHVSESRMKCVNHNQEGNYHRPRNNITTDPFTPAMKAAVKLLNDQVERAILERKEKKHNQTYPK